MTIDKINRANLKCLKFHKTFLQDELYKPGLRHSHIIYEKARITHNLLIKKHPNSYSECEPVRCYSVASNHDCPRT